MTLPVWGMETYVFGLFLPQISDPNLIIKKRPHIWKKYRFREVWVKTPFILHFYHIFTYFQFSLRTFWSTHPMNLNQRALQSPDVVEASRYFEHYFLSYRKFLETLEVKPSMLWELKNPQNHLKFGHFSRFCFHCVFFVLRILWSWFGVR